VVHSAEVEAMESVLADLRELLAELEAVA